MDVPLGMAYISSYVKKLFPKIRIGAIDFCAKEYDLNDIPLDGDIYCIGGMTSQFPYIQEIHLYLKAKRPGANIVLGGPHFTAVPQDRLSSEDTVIKGCGEFGMASYLLQNKQLENNIGTFSLKHDDIDKFPFPDRKLFGMDNYKRTLNGKRAAHIITSRGCCFSCQYCNQVTETKRLHYRDVDSVLEEFDQIRIDFGINSFIIYDDTFNLNRKRTHELCKGLRDRNSEWRCWSRADILDEEILLEMKASGMKGICIGVETGDDRLLQAVGKGTTVEQNRKALLLCKKLNISVRCSLMFGLPFETSESVINTIKLIDETQPDEWNLLCLKPLPGSPIWNNPGKYGMSIDKRHIRNTSYKGTNFIDETGVGSIGGYFDYKHLPWDTYTKMLKYMVSELERVCPRKDIYDSIQKIDVSGI